MAVFAIVLGYGSLRNWLDDWLPVIGGMDSGYVLAQTVLLAFVAILVFGTVVWLSYDTLSDVFD